MELYPAIDVRGGRVARVPPGQPDDPLDLLATWAATGARWVHLVDLDRAYGTGTNRDVIQRLLRTARSGGALQVQVGGGLGSVEEIDEVFAWGADRVVAGAALAVTDNALRRLVERLGPGRIAVAVEVRENRLAPRGAGGSTASGRFDLALEQFVDHVSGQGIQRLVYTDVTRDGALTGPDIAGARRLARPGTDVIVSGGVGSLDDLRRVRAASLSGAIVGRALHEARFTLAEALACLSD